MVDLHVLASVINVELAHINANVVLVGQGIVDFLDLGVTCEDLLLHQVQSGLDGSRVISGEGIGGDLANASVDSREVDGTELDRTVGGKGPLAVNSSGEDTIPDFRKGGVFILVETVEGRASCLQDQELLKTGGDEHLVTSTLAINASNLDILAVADERVRVGLAINQEASPLVLDDINMDLGDVLVLLQHVLSDLHTKHFNVINVLAALGKNVDSVLASVYIPRSAPPKLQVSVSSSIIIPVVTTTELSALV